MKFKVGDLIEYEDYNGLPISIGIVLKVLEIRSIGSLLEVFWDNGEVGKFLSGNRTKVIA